MYDHKTASRFISTFSHSLRFLMAALILLLLFLPKINLVQVGGSKAGLRFDDLALLSVFFLIGVATLAGKRPFLKVESYFLFFFFFSLLSWLLNNLLFNLGIVNGRSSILYVLRPLEYFSFFYVGLIAYEFITIRKVVLALLGANLFVILLQSQGIIGGFSVNGYKMVSSAPIGLTAGNWEVGFLLNLFAAQLLFSSEFLPFLERYKTSITWRNHFITFNYATAAVFTFFLSFTLIIGSRSSAACLLLLGVAKLFEGIPRKKLFIFTSLFLLISAALSYLFMDQLIAFFSDFRLFRRSQQLFRWKNIEMFINLIAHIDVEQMSFIESYKNLSWSADADYDISWFIRMHKWSYAIKYYLTHPSTYLLGLGPGYCGGALDGGSLRLFVENGVVGASLFWYFFYKATSQDRGLKPLLFVLLLYMSFIDIYFAYKAMSFFYFIIGLYISHTAKYDF